MSFKLLTISSLYPEYLKSYYQKYPYIKNKSYIEQYEHLLDDTSELVAPYTKMFNKLGVNAVSIITNANYLQEKWKSENGIKSQDDNILVYEQVKMFKPDILWLENVNYIERKWIDLVRDKNPGIKLIIASHSAPYNTKILKNFKNLDFIITCTPGLQYEFEKNGLKAFLVYHGFDPVVLEKVNTENKMPKNNFIFSGSLFMGGGFHTKRLELLEEIFKENIDLKIYGNLEKKYKIWAKKSVYYTIKLLNHINMGKYIRNFPLLYKHEEYGTTLITNYSNDLIKATESPVFGIDMYKLLKNSKITLNIHGEVAGNYAGNMRLFETTGVGSCLLTDNKKNMDELFEKDTEVVVFDNFDDCIDKVKWLLDNEDKRKEIAKSGQIRTLKSHTVEKRCRLIIGIINRELK